MDLKNINSISINNELTYCKLTYCTTIAEIMKMFSNEDKNLNLLFLPLTLLYFLYLNNIIKNKKIRVIKVIIDKYIYDIIFFRYLKKKFNVEKIYLIMYSLNRHYIEFYNNEYYVDKIIIQKQYKYPKYIKNIKKIIM